MRNIRNQREADAFLLTTQRRVLLDLLRAAGGHIDARELHRRASRSDHPVSLATVYRNLRRFRDLGLIDEHQLGQRSQHYEARHQTEHQHFVCRDCGRVMEFRNPLIGKLVGVVQREQGFVVTRTALYLEGHCRDCQA